MYRFKSKAASDLIMMAPVGDQILRIVGREPAPQGIIEAAALPQAIRALEEAIAAAELARRDAKHADDDDDDRGAEAVGRARRHRLGSLRRSRAAPPPRPSMQRGTP